MVDYKKQEGAKKLSDEEIFRQRFTKYMSHEFFNPLCIAQGYLYLLEGGRYGKLTDEQRKQIQSISQNLKRIERLVRDSIQTI
jgi:signal transduction histidine kinase